MNQLGEPDAGKLHVRFDERGLETGFRLLRQSSTLLIGALSAVTFQQIGLSSLSQGERVFAHALAGGTLEVLSGGKFGHGFVSAGWAKP